MPSRALATDTGAGHRPVHFLVDDAAGARDTGDWDPDGEPTRFASGVGHNLIELYARLRDRDRSVSIGPRIPRHCRLVVAYGWQFRTREQVRLVRSGSRTPVLLIRSDAPLDWEPWFPSDLTVVPNSAPRWTQPGSGPTTRLPALPQRGLRPRERGRFGELRSAAFKGFPTSLPDYLNDPGFLRGLTARGIALAIDVPTLSDMSDQRWHDFSSVDLALCVRNHRSRSDLDRKPATRLINAWLAGCIPLVDPEPAYLELIRDGVDGFVVDGPSGILRAIDALRCDSQLLANVESEVLALRQRWLPSVILDLWDDLLFGREWAQLGNRRYAERACRTVAGAVSDVARRRRKSIGTVCSAGPAREA